MAWGLRMLVGCLLALSGLACAQVRINCGSFSDSAVGAVTWGGDTFFDNGRTFSQGLPLTTAADLGELATIVPADVFQSGRRQRYTLSYTIPVPAGQYTVNLYFMEDDEPAGGRVFDVLVQDAVVRSNLDVAALVGQRAAYVVSVNVVTSSQAIKVECRQGQTQWPQIRGISVLPGVGATPPTDPPTPPPSTVLPTVVVTNNPPTAPAGFARRINCGWPSSTTLQGITWEADGDFLNGRPTYQGDPVVTAAELGNLAGQVPVELFHAGRRQRYQVSYSVPAPPGTYTVKLYFMEDETAAVPGSRAFHVLVNGVTVYSNLDVTQLVGVRKPYVVTTTATSTGSLLIECMEGRTQWPLIKAIEILSTTSAPPTNPPTNRPTNPPTNAPTNAPTNPPTNPPTYEPGMCPTSAGGDALGWTVADSHQVTYHEAQGLAFDGAFYLVGGFKDGWSAMTGDTFKYVPGVGWQQLASMPIIDGGVTHAGQTVRVSTRQIILCGGFLVEFGGRWSSRSGKSTAYVHLYFLFVEKNEKKRKRNNLHFLFLYFFSISFIFFRFILIFLFIFLFCAAARSCTTSTRTHGRSRRRCGCPKNAVPAPAPWWTTGTCTFSAARSATTPRMATAGRRT